MTVPRAGTRQRAWRVPQSCHLPQSCRLGGLSHLVPVPHADVPPHAAGPSPAPIGVAAGAESEKGRPGAHACHSSGVRSSARRAVTERPPAILGCWTEPRTRCHGPSLGR